MIGSDSREGSRQDCENFLNEMKGMYKIISSSIDPIGDHWIVYVSYEIEE